MLIAATASWDTRAEQGWGDSADLGETISSHPPALASIPIPKANPSYALQRGYQLHWYRIESVLSEGGFGITYLAHDLNLDRKVAIKEYLPSEVAVRNRDSTVGARSQAVAETFGWGLARFMIEASTLSKFDHPNIVRVHSVFEANSTAYMVMQYEAGEDLSQVLDREGALSEEQIRQWLTPILDGLEVVHEGGFVHRDIKPANIILRNDGSAVLIDFGAARQSRLTEHAMTSLVTHGYSPIEQCSTDGHLQGPWTDLYALGATLYHAVTGERPIPAESRNLEILSTGADPLAPVAAGASARYSANLLAIIDRAMQMPAHERPQNVAEWRREFERALPEPNATAIHEDLLTVARSFDLETQAPPLSSDAETEFHSSADWRMTDCETAVAPARETVAPQDRPKQPVQETPSAASRFLPVLLPMAALTVGLVAATVLRPLIFDSGPALANTEGERVVVPVRESISAPAPVHVPADEIRTTPTPRATSGSVKPHNPQVTALLMEAERHLDAGRLSIPKGESAVDRLRDVLALDPGNTRAAERLEYIGRRYATLARSAAADGRFGTASLFMDEARALNANDAEIQAADTYVTEQINHRAAGDDAIQAQIDALLAKAETAFTNEQATTPGVSEAIRHVNTALALDPTNRDATIWLGRIWAHYEESIRSSALSYDADAARRWLEVADKAFPGDARVTRLRNEYRALLDA